MVYTPIRGPSLDFVKQTIITNQISYYRIFNRSGSYFKRHICYLMSLFKQIIFQIVVIKRIEKPNILNLYFKSKEFHHREFDKPRSRTKSVIYK